MFCIMYQCFFGDQVQLGDFMPRQLWWIYPMNAPWGLPGKGEFHTQVQELKAFPDRFLGYFRMPLKKYFEVMNQIHNNRHVAKQNTNFWKCIGIEERLAVFLWWVLFWNRLVMQMVPNILLLSHSGKWYKSLPKTRYRNKSVAEHEMLETPQHTKLRENAYSLLQNIKLFSWFDLFHGHMQNIFLQHISFYEM